MLVSGQSGCREAAGPRSCPRTRRPRPGSPFKPAARSSPQPDPGPTAAGPPRHGDYHGTRGSVLDLRRALLVAGLPARGRRRGSRHALGQPRRTPPPPPSRILEAQGRATCREPPARGDDVGAKPITRPSPIPTQLEQLFKAHDAVTARWLDWARRREAHRLPRHERRAPAAHGGVPAGAQGRRRSASPPRRTRGSPQKTSPSTAPPSPTTRSRSTSPSAKRAASRTRTSPRSSASASTPPST